MYVCYLRYSTWIEHGSLIYKLVTYVRPFPRYVRSLLPGASISKPWWSRLWCQSRPCWCTAAAMGALLRLARLKGAALTSTAQGHKHGTERQPSWAVFVPPPGVMLLVAPVTSRSVPFRWQLLRPRRRESGQAHCAGPYTNFAHACAQWWTSAQRCPCFALHFRYQKLILHQCNTWRWICQLNKHAWCPREL